MENKNIVTYQVGQFHWHKDDKEFSCEHSDLNSGRIFDRVYDDACDVGFAMYNPKTGKTVRFYLASTDKCPDEEVAGWWFKPIPEDVRKNPRLEEVKVLVIND